jgi:hypothetical protein
MLKKITFLIAALSLSTIVAAQEKKAVTVADFVGTWNIEAMSHQIALVIEPADGNKVTATMMMMDRDTLLKGELAGRTLTLVGVKTEPSANASSAAPDHDHGGPATKQAPKPITVTLMEDGTIEGEMMTNMGPTKWTGEKLKTRKPKP